MELNEAAIMTLRDITHLMEQTIKQIDVLEQDLEFEKHRCAGLANDKIKLSEKLDDVADKASWSLVSNGKCPDGIRLLVKGNKTQPTFATLSGGTWMNNRMLLDFSPTHWIKIPD